MLGVDSLLAHALSSAVMNYGRGRIVISIGSRPTTRPQLATRATHDPAGPSGASTAAHESVCLCGQSGSCSSG